jgi:TolB protein
MRRILIGLVACGAAGAVWSAPAPKGEEKATGILIVSKRDGNADIYLVDPKGENARNLTNNNSEDSYPAWSPDGKKIAFASDRDGTTNIYVMDADGGNVKQLTKGDDRSRCPAWSPDGKKIAFGRAVGATSCGVFVMDADGSNVKQLGDGDGWNPAWSPDGKKILFATRRDGDGFCLYDMDPDGTNARQLTTNINPYGSVYPCYSPDGKKILWTDGDGTSLEVHVADADGKNVKKLTELGGMNTFAIWSADGKSIVFHHMPDFESGPVYIMDADGGNRRELLKSEGLVKGARPAWRPK